MTKTITRADIADSLYAEGRDHQNAGCDRAQSDQTDHQFADRLSVFRSPVPHLTLLSLPLL